MSSAPRSISTPWLYLVREADPDFDRAKHHELAYEFDSFGNGRRFYVDPSRSGSAHSGGTTFLITEDAEKIVVSPDGAPPIVVE